MKAIALYICFLVSSWMPHDVAVAVFTLYESSEKLQLKVVIDRADLCKELSILETDLTVKTVQEYLDKHCQFSINDSPIFFEVNQVKNDEDHIIVQTVLISTIKEYRHIALDNTCLNTIANHSNIIRIKLNDTQRDFRMHKGRKKIECTY